SPEIQKSERVINLRERLSQLKEPRDTLLVIYTPEWPEVKKLDAAIKPLQEELNRAAQETIGALKSAYEAALAHEESVESMYGQQKGVTTQQTRASIEMAQ